MWYLVQKYLKNAKLIESQIRRAGCQSVIKFNVTGNTAQINWLWRVDNDRAVRERKRTPITITVVGTLKDRNHLMDTGLQVSVYLRQLKPGIFTHRFVEAKCERYSRRNFTRKILSNYVPYFSVRHLFVWAHQLQVNRNLRTFRIRTFRTYEHSTY
jgi:hypothetical protein